MRKVVLSGLAGLLPLLAIGCGGANPEPIVRERIEVNNQLARALENSNDLEAAELQKRLRTLQTRLDALELSDDAKKSLDARFAADLGAAEEKVKEAAVHGPIKGTITGMNDLADALDRNDLPAVQALATKIASLKAAIAMQRQALSAAQQKQLDDRYGPAMFGAAMKLGGSSLKASDEARKILEKMPK